LAGFAIANLNDSARVADLVAMKSDAKITMAAGISIQNMLEDKIMQGSAFNLGAEFLAPLGRGWIAPA